MARFVVLLRGINVGGRRSVRMDALRSVLRSAGLENVSTCLQSGNVLFDAAGGTPKSLERIVGHTLDDAFGSGISVLVRPKRRIDEIVRRDPFGATHTGRDEKRYVTFLATRPRRRLSLPLVSPRGDVELFEIDGGEAFCLSRKVRGRRGFPNRFLEATLGTTATTRDWNTVLRIAGM